VLKTRESQPGTRPRRADAGFTLVEMLVSMGLTVVIVGAAIVAAVNARKATATVSLALEMNGALRSATDLIVRDLLQTGQGLPSGKVIEKPNGGTATAIRRPGPPASGLTYVVADTHFTAVGVGSGLGPAFREPQVGGGNVTGPATDIISVLYVDSQFDALSCTIASTGRSMTVPAFNAAVAGTANITGTGVLDPMAAGDLVMITNGSGSAMLLTTGVTGQVVNFAAGDAMNLNQVTGTDGTVRQLLPTPVAATPATWSRVRLVTYFVDNAVDPPRLMRQLNYNTPRAVAVGIDNMQISYDIADGATNPVNVKTPTTPTQIRKVNLYLSSRSRDRSQTGQYLRNSLATQIALRSLAFVDRYQ
jgi:type II secretory pathway pseudopilin PulG